MIIAVTGGEGFLGRHLRVRLKALRPETEVITIDRACFGDPNRLAEAIAPAEVVVHLAGINRGSDAELDDGNARLAEALVRSLVESGSKAKVLNGNSLQMGNGTPYGTGKARAAEVICEWATRRGLGWLDVVLPNVFGEGCRPDYNSFVATFCDRLARYEQPEVLVDRAVLLMHAQDVAGLLIDLALDESAHGEIRPPGVELTVSETLGRLVEIADTYRDGTFPDLGDPLTLRLFNTYRSYLHPQAFPMRLVSHADARGQFVEAAKTTGGESQASFSTTVPGVTRGNHFHLRKVERFAVMRGTAQISIRPVLGGPAASFGVSGDVPSVVDMPTLHTHNITNTGDGDLYTMFWISELFDPADPDTFPEVV